MDTNTLSEISPVYYTKATCPWAVTEDFEHKFILQLISQNFHKEMKTRTIASQTTYGQQSLLHTFLIINNEKWEIRGINYLLHFVTEETRKKPRMDKTLVIKLYLWQERILFYISVEGFSSIFLFGIVFLFFSFSLYLWLKVSSQLSFK